MNSLVKNEKSKNHGNNQSYSFINKDAGNIASGNHKFAVSSHVENWKKQQRGSSSPEVPTSPSSSRDPTNWRRESLISWRTSTTTPRHSPREANGEESDLGQAGEDQNDARHQRHNSRTLTQNVAKILSTKTALASITLNALSSLPYQLDANDQALFHHYMVVMPEAMFNVRATGTYNLHLGNGFAMAMLSPIVLHWILLGSENHIASQRSSSTIPESIHRRRAQAYRETNDAIAVSNTTGTYSDNLVAAVAAAIVMDSFWSSAQVLKTHIAGLDKLIQARGGVRSLRSNHRLHSFTAFAHLLCHGGIVRNAAHLQETKAAFQSKMRDLKEWNALLRRDPSRAFNLRNENTGVIKHYRHVRASIFNRRSHIGRALTHGSNSSLSQTCHLATPYLLNLALYDFRADVRGATRYLENLSEAIEENASVDAKGGDELITLLGITGMLIHGGFGDGEFSRSWKTIDALKVFHSGAVDDDAKRGVKEVLMGWIFEAV